MKKSFLSKIILAISTISLFHTPYTATIDLKALKEELSVDSWQNISKATFLLLAGAWLAHRQIPRLTWQEVEYNDPIITLIGASILATIGIIGSMSGATQLALIANKKL